MKTTVSITGWDNEDELANFQTGSENEVGRPYLRVRRSADGSGTATLSYDNVIPFSTPQPTPFIPPPPRPPKPPGPGAECYKQLRDCLKLYSYDAANRMTSRNAPNGVTSSYAYDGWIA